MAFTEIQYWNSIFYDNRYQQNIYKDIDLLKLQIQIIRQKLLPQTKYNKKEIETFLNNVSSLISILQLDDFNILDDDTENEILEYLDEFNDLIDNIPVKKDEWIKFWNLIDQILNEIYNTIMVNANFDTLNKR